MMRLKPVLDEDGIIRANTRLPGFNLTISDLYFTILVEVFTSHSLAANSYFTNHAKWIEHKIVGFKPANKYHIIWQCHNF